MSQQERALFSIVAHDLGFLRLPRLPEPCLRF
jgi:hypothetical protein